MKPVDPFLLARGVIPGTRNEYMSPNSAGQPYIPRRAPAIQHLAAWKHGQEGDDAWLCRLLAFSFQRLVAMALPGQPAAEMLPVTAEMWRDVLLDMRVSEDDDRERIEAGFRYLYRKIREWPQPADLIEQMPKRETRRDPRDIRVRRERTEAEETTATEALAGIKEIFRGGQR